MNRNRASNGFALIMTLWVMAILSTMLLTFGMLTRNNLRGATALVRDTEAAFTAKGAFHRVALELVPPEEPGTDYQVAAVHGELTGTYIVDTDAWKVTKLGRTDRAPEADNQTVCQVTAEDARLPLNRTTKSMFARLPRMTPVIVDRLFVSEPKLDEPDADRGGEQQQGQPASAAATGGAGNWSAVEELLGFEGVAGPVYDGDKEGPGLKELLTAHSDGRVYLNKASRHVLRALPGVDDQMAREIELMLKSGRMFERVEDLQHALGVTPAVYKALSPWVKVLPGHYRIRATSRAGKMVKVVEGVVRVSGGRAEVLFMSGV